MQWSEGQSEFWIQRHHFSNTQCFFFSTEIRISHWQISESPTQCNGQMTNMKDMAIGSTQQLVAYSEHIFTSSPDIGQKLADCLRKPKLLLLIEMKANSSLLRAYLMLPSLGVVCSMSNLTLLTHNIHCYTYWPTIITCFWHVIILRTP